MAEERRTNLELRQSYTELQGKVAALAGSVREGLKWDEGQAIDGELEGLKSIQAWAEIQNENRVLRSLMGLLPADD